MKEPEKHLIIGLGNPGQEYKHTRHNLGFEVVDYFAEHHGLVFHESKRFFGLFAEGKVQGKQVALLKPMTFMNLSGGSIKSCMEYFAIAQERILVICDDILIALGKMRMRMKGASGGHNGLKSVQLNLATEEYARLRIGVDSPQLGENLSDYVMGHFTKEQKQIIKKLLPFTALVLDEWLVKGISSSMQLAHSYPDCKTKE